MQPFEWMLITWIHIECNHHMHSRIPWSIHLRLTGCTNTWVDNLVTSMKLFTMGLAAVATTHGMAKGHVLTTSRAQPSGFVLAPFSMATLLHATWCGCGRTESLVWREVHNGSNWRPLLAWCFMSILDSNGLLMARDLVVVNHFISQLVDKFIEAFFNTTTAFVHQETVNDSYGKDTQTESLGPIMCTKLLLNINSILAHSVVLINASTVTVVQISCLG